MLINKLVIGNLKLINNQPTPPITTDTLSPIGVPKAWICSEIWIASSLFYNSISFQYICYIFFE